MPEEVKRLVCLANSRKLGGRCVAGKELLPDGSMGAWVRPVANQGSGEVPVWECMYQDGSEPAVLDILEVPVIGHVPKVYQRENWELDQKRLWRKLGRVTYEEASRHVDALRHLWKPGYNTYNGLNDHVPLEEAKRESDSLRLIKVTNLALSVRAPGRHSAIPQEGFWETFAMRGSNTGSG